MPEETWAERRARLLASCPGLARELSLVNTMVDANTVSNEDYAKELLRIARVEEIRTDDWIYEKNAANLNKYIGHSSGMISLPRTTPEEHLAKAKDSSLATLRENSEDIILDANRELNVFIHREFQPDKNPETFRDEKWAKDDGFTIGSRSCSNSFRVEFSVEAFTALQKECLEVIAVAKEDSARRERICKIYADELARRGKDEPAEVARITAELSRVVKDAETQKKIIVKAMRDCKSSGLKDAVAARSFLNAKRRFHELSGEHHSLTKQLAAVNVSGRKQRFARFSA